MHVARQDGDVIFGVWRPLAAASDFLPLRPIENVTAFHKRLKTEDLSLLLLNKQ